MIRIHRKVLFNLICILAFLTSCNSYSNDNQRSNSASEKYKPLQVDTIDNMAEIATWNVLERGTTVTHVQHNFALNRLTVVGEQTNKLVLFDIDKEEIIDQQNIDIPDLRVLDIDKTGENLLVGMSGQALDEQGAVRNFFHWIGVWNVEARALDACLSISCTDKLTDPDHIILADIGAVIDAETVVSYNENSYAMTTLSPESSGKAVLINSPDADYWWHIGKMAINSSQNQLAIVFQEGRIVLQEIVTHNLLPLKNFEVLENGNGNQLQQVQNLILDTHGKWLATIIGKRLSIWKIGSWVKKKVYREQIGDTHGMTFNSSGDLLFVAVNDHIQIIGLQNAKVILEIQTPNISSFDISKDNQLLFWGDENGIIHMWGIPIIK